jgi:putative RNA 2'-phosphotransferase
MPLDHTRLSKTVSHALRHQPWLYELEPDSEGWVSVEDLLEALRERKAWRNLAAADIAAMVEGSDKRRFEMRDGRIRALYGHSIPGKLSREPARPPAVLYHGTSPGAARQRPGLVGGRHPGRIHRGRG